MSIQAVLLPVFAQVALTFGLLVWTASRRLAAVRAGAVDRRDVSCGQRAWPAPAQQVSNALQNQFELPVLFLSLVPLAVITRKADLAFVAMSWLFVGSRAAHAVVYGTSNHVPHRLAAYLVGVVLLVAMWLVFAGRLLSAPLPA